MPVWIGSQEETPWEKDNWAPIGVAVWPWIWLQGSADSGSINRRLELAGHLIRALGSPNRIYV